jgi:hypothetical protein
MMIAAAVVIGTSKFASPSASRAATASVPA